MPWSSGFKNYFPRCSVAVFLIPRRRIPYALSLNSMDGKFFLGPKIPLYIPLICLFSQNFKSSSLLIFLFPFFSCFSRHWNNYGFTSAVKVLTAILLGIRIMEFPMILNQVFSYLLRKSIFAVTFGNEKGF